MYNGDRSRKEMLVNYGPTLPSALDNRPLRQGRSLRVMCIRIVYVSARHQATEMNRRETVVSKSFTTDRSLGPGKCVQLWDRIQCRVEKNERTFITTLTKKMAEDLTRTTSKEMGIQGQVHALEY